MFFERMEKEQIHVAKQNQGGRGNAPSSVPNVISILLQLNTKTNILKTTTDPYNVLTARNFSSQQVH